MLEQQDKSRMTEGLYHARTSEEDLKMVLLAALYPRLRSKVQDRRVWSNQGKDWKDTKESLDRVMQVSRADRSPAKRTSDAVVRAMWTHRAGRSPSTKRQSEEGCLQMSANFAELPEQDVSSYLLSELERKIARFTELYQDAVHQEQLPEESKMMPNKRTNESRWSTYEEGLCLAHTIARYVDAQKSVSPSEEGSVLPPVKKTSAMICDGPWNQPVDIPDAEEFPFYEND